jgi:sugar lactone lactonase YvrE
MAKHHVALGIDIGGSGIKGAVVNLEKGEFTTKRKKILTPKPATPEAVIEVVAQLVDHFLDDIDDNTAVGVTVPAVVQHGVVLSAANIDPTWIEFEGEKALEKRLGRDVYLVNDADAAGNAEQHYGSGKDDNGYISWVSAANPDSAVVFAQGGRNGVTLDSPKGMAIHGDTLWVADINFLRGFDRKTGAPLANIDFTAYGAVQLNDVAIGPDSTIRVTDTGIIMGKAGVKHIGPDHIFIVGPGGRISAPQQGPDLHQPNGITWDPVGKRWIVLSFDRLQGQIAELPLDMSTRKVLFQSTVTTQLDGVEMLPDGAIMYTSWADSAIHVLSGATDRTIIRAVPVPADIGVDTKRHHLAIPLSMLGRVQLWDIASVSGMPLRR